MGTYINPGNAGFAGIVSDEYVDKTGLIALVDRVIGTPRKLVCVTRPRRFGKTFAAESVSAFYSCGCDSRSLFEGMEISRNKGWDRNLNSFNVVRLDMTEFAAVCSANIVDEVQDRIIAELKTVFPDVAPGNWFTAALLNVVRATGRQFFFVIDEWDAPLREAKTEDDKERWVKFLRLLFKNASFTSEAVAGAYMTGILPIKRYGTQSALSDFWEYTMLDPSDFAPYVGFTEEEVKAIAVAHSMDINALRQWYDGYQLPRAGHVYAPFSVMQSCLRGMVGPYWTSSETFESLRLFIDLDFDGLQQTIVQALGGAEVSLDTGSFENDMRETRNRDDVLTLLVHLGYLAYDFDSRKACVPNEEVRAELRRAIRESRHIEVARIVRESDALLRATWDLDEEAVEAGIAQAHDHGCTPLFYNDEQALRAVVKAAYISAADHYATIEELPSGRGYADIVYLPKRGSTAPAMLVELKWDRPVVTALDQIHQNDYPDVLRDWDGPVLLVDVSYDVKTKAHICTIEELAPKPTA